MTKERKFRTKINTGRKKDRVERKIVIEVKLEDKQESIVVRTCKASKAKKRSQWSDKKGGSV